LASVHDKQFESKPIKETAVAKKTKMAKRGKRVAWTKAHERELRGHSRNKTTVKSIARSMKRTPGALRQKAHAMGLALGHRR
jgi:hypothetical protein